MISKFKKDPLFITRIILAIGFIAHGISKLTALQGGVPESFFGMPGFVFVIVAIAELLAGVGILIDKYTKTSAIVIAVIMVGAILIANLQKGYMGGYELDLAYFAMAVTLAIDASNRGKK